MTTCRGLPDTCNTIRNNTFATISPALIAISNKHTMDCAAASAAAAAGAALAALAAANTTNLAARVNDRYALAALDADAWAVARAEADATSALLRLPFGCY